MNELISLLEGQLSPEEIVELLNFVLHNYYDSKEELSEFALEHNICPKCASPLMIKTWYEPRGEHFGHPCKEAMSELYCEYCGVTF